MKYILINWPQSQKFMEDNRCFSCIEIKGAIFVPENVYDYYVNGNVNIKYNYGHNVSYKEYYGG